MQAAARTFNNLGLSVLLLAGPILGFAAKGFAPLMTVAGTLALIGLVLEKTQLATVNWRTFWPIAPFLIYVFFSFFWSTVEGTFTSFGVLLSILTFTFCLWQAFLAMSQEKQAAFRSRLSISLLAGIFCALAVGSYPVTYPDLPALTAKWSEQVPFGNLQLLRQGNRSLSLTPIFLFLLAGIYWKEPKIRVPIIAFLALAFFITFHSKSQTSFLGMVVGLSFLILAIIPIKHKRIWLLSLTLLGTCMSPHLFSKSFDEKWVENFLPKTISKRSSAKDRQFLYYVFSKETLERPLFGHGFESSHSFRPNSFDEYYQLARERRLTSSIKLMKKNGNLQAHPHNLPLQLLFEFGYIGVGLFFFDSA